MKYSKVLKVHKREGAKRIYAFFGGGPKMGKEYWAIIFDYLKSEVTTGNNSEIGFSFSADGLNWPAENAQIIDLSKGLPLNTNPWWRATEFLIS